MVEAFVVESDSAAYFDTSAEAREYFDRTASISRWTGLSEALDSIPPLSQILASPTAVNFGIHDKAQSSR